MKAFLTIFIMILVLVETAVGWKAVLDRYDIKYINEKRLKLIEAKIFKYNRTTKAVTAEIEILYDITPLVMIEIKIFGFMSNEYRPLPFILKRRVCDILQLEYQLLKHNLNTNCPDSCPMTKGRYYLRNYSIDVSRLPKRPWSINDYKIQTRIFYKNEEEALFDLYAITTDDDEYVV